MLSRRIRRALGVPLATLVLLLGGCQPAVSAPAAPFAAAPSATPEEADGAAGPAAVEVAAQNPPSSPTPLPTSTTEPTATPTATPAATATATVAPTATPTGPCAARMPGDDLLTVVTQTYGLSKEYEPQDLVALIDYLPFEVTLGYPTELREVAVEPLVEMITAMQAEGLRPQVISGYRSYVAQVIARNKWEEQYPGHVGIISALPGHSEHQLGTAVDFGSPELPEIVGQEDIEFHTYFYQTSEGKWLAEHAHRYGFTLSYTREAFETTGFFYEPWHYRYVGVETATMLRDQGLTLTEYQLRDGEPPCTE